MMELHKRRRAVTEPETRYFMMQIVLGVQYMHDTKVSGWIYLTVPESKDLSQ